MTESRTPVAKLWALIREEKTDITAIYFFAALSGLIQLSLPVGIQAIIGFVLGGTLSASLALLISILVAAVIFAGIIRINQMRIIEKIQQGVFVRYSFAFADRIPKLDMRAVDGTYLPELTNHFFDVMSIQKGFSKLLLTIPVALIQIVFGLLLLCFYHPFFIMFGVVIVALLWLILRITGKSGLKSSLAESGYKYRVAAWLQEMARLMKTFKFSNTDLHLTRADEKTGDYLKARTAHFRVLEFQYKILIVFKVLITTAMLIGGVVLLLDQQINIGQFVAAEIIIITVISSIEKIITNLDNVYDVLTAVEKIEMVVEKPLEKTGSLRLGAGEAISLKAEGLSFAYSDRTVISGLSFDIADGDKVLLEGASGTGKSTLLRILTGVFADFGGKLLLNGVPIGNYDLASVRKNTAILFQHENIFRGTLWENLTMGNDNIDQQYLLDLCNTTGLASYVSTLPAGFDTELDPTGRRLSAGTVQKILLVRALSNKPALLLLEEPWQGLGDAQRDELQEFIANLQHTTVIVSATETISTRGLWKQIRLENKLS